MCHSIKQIIEYILKENTPKRITKSAFFVFLCSIIGFVLLCTVFVMPVDSIEKNVEESADTLNSEGMYPNLFEWCTSRIDNYTDSIMLLEAANDSDKPLADKAVYVYRNRVDKELAYQSLISHYIDNEEFTGESSYPRYWHGYLLYVKPLLAIFSYHEIRIINGILQILLTLLFLYLLYRKDLKEYIIPYSISYLMLMPLAIANCLQYSSCFYIFTICNIVLLIRKRIDYYYVFLISGIMTAYIDFLTYPSACLAMPLLTYIILNKNKDNNSLLADLISLSFYWCMGYGLMWFNKWLLASVLTGTNLFTDALNAVLRRSANSVDGSSINTFSVVSKNLKMFFKTPFTMLFIAYAIYKMIVKNRAKYRSTSIYPFLYVALIPIAWYIIVSNHSLVHAYFTCKACVPIVMSVLCYLTYTDDGHEC